LLGAGHVHEAFAQGGDGFVFLVAHEQVLFACAGLGEVDGGEDAFLGDLAVEDDLHVPGALELFEDDLIARAAGVDEA